MSCVIEVKRRDEGGLLGFDVVVREGKGETKHRVTMATAMYARLSGGARHSDSAASDASVERVPGKQPTPEQVIDASFRFLLEREPKESILARFDVSVIARYFPDFEHNLPRYLPGL